MGVAERAGEKKELEGSSSRKRMRGWRESRESSKKVECECLSSKESFLFVAVAGAENGAWVGGSVIRESTDSAREKGSIIFSGRQLLSISLLALMSLGFWGSGGWE